jgi:cytochrome c5
MSAFCRWPSWSWRKRRQPRPTASRVTARRYTTQSAWPATPAGVAGAPKAGDKEAWAPRIATGTDALILSVTNGKGAMPPKGGGADLTDEEIKAAVEHLVGLAQ